MLSEIAAPKHAILFNKEWLVRSNNRWGLAYTSLEELIAICHFASICDGNIVEIGCNEGYTTAALAVNHPGRLIYAIDYIGTNSTMRPEQRHEMPSVIARQARNFSNVRPINQDSTTLDYSKLSNVRMVFIDGGHHFEQVKADSELAITHLRSQCGGYILWHDYDSVGPYIDVKRYIDTELAPKCQVHRILNTGLVVAKI